MTTDATQTTAGSSPVECQVRRVRIKVGAIVSQDHAFGRWPATRAGGDVDPDMVFDAEYSGAGYWECRADGHGRRSWMGEEGGYGNGSIYAFGDDAVTVLGDGPNVLVSRQGGADE